MIVKQGLLGWVEIISYGVYIKLKQRKGLQLINAIQLKVVYF